MKINITRATPDYSYFFQDKIEATPVVLKGFEDFSFFIHKNKFSNTPFADFHGRKLVLTEATTGLIVFGEDNKALLIQRATEFLINKVKPALKKQIIKRLKQLKLNKDQSVQVSDTTEVQ
jgi:hypothetical protein